MQGKLAGLERRIENLETSGEGDSRARNEVHELKGKVRDFSVELDNLRNRNMSSERKMSEMMRRIDQSNASLALNTVKIADMGSKNVPHTKQAIYSYNGILHWKIGGYQRRLQDAIDGVQTALLSDAFYSGQPGYKMCAKIYFNGDGEGKGTHLSLFVVILRGELIDHAY